MRQTESRGNKRLGNLAESNREMNRFLSFPFILLNDSVLHLNVVRVFFFQFSFQILRLDSNTNIRVNSQTRKVTSCCIDAAITGGVGTPSLPDRHRHCRGVFLKLMGIGTTSQAVGTQADHLRKVRFQVLTAATMKFRFVFWVVLPCTAAIR
jgi:hypothetical protein